MLLALCLITIYLVGSWIVSWFYNDDVYESFAPVVLWPIFITAICLFYLMTWPRHIRDWMDRL